MKNEIETYTATCSRCEIDEPVDGCEHCESCAALLLRPAIMTAIVPTAGEWNARELFENVIEISEGTPRRWIATVDHSFAHEQVVSNAAVICVANQMWEFVLAAAKNNPRDLAAAEIVARADSIYRAILEPKAVSS